MRTQISGYTCKQCNKETLGFTVKAHPTDSYTSLITVNCSNCSREYPEVKSDARTNNRTAHRENVIERLSLEKA